MFKMVSGFLLLLWSIAFVGGPRLLQEKGAQGKTLPLSGVYELVSETTVLTAPQVEESLRTSADWAGQWQFCDGHYSRIYMKRQRDKFFDSNKKENLGFEASAGSFELKGTTLYLTSPYELSPLGVGGSSELSYRLEEDNLILTKTLYKTVESPGEGQVTTVLRRIK